MAYVALYRQYRPKTFDEIAGQTVIVKTLKNALINNQLAHAYLFAGPRGTGKTTIAKIVAKAANCLESPVSNPCGKCSVCVGIEKGDITDVIEIDAASNNGVDEIRELRENAKYAPGVGKYKVYIIDEVHMLSNSAFNALLKTLEEPPKHVIFILATTEIHKIPPTIISRCQRFDFKNLENNEIVDKLKEICKIEEIKITDEALNLIAEDAQGGMRDAISLLDQVRAYKSDELTKEDVLLVSGGVSTDIIVKLIKAINEKNVSEVLNIFDDLINNGKDPSRIIIETVNLLKQVLLDRYLKEAKYPDLIKINIAKIYFYLDEFNSLSNKLRYTNQKRVYFELSLLRMIQDPQIDAIDLQSQINFINTKIEELNNQTQLISEETKKVKYVSKNNSNETKVPLVTIKDVENILNNANKDVRIQAEKNWDKLGNLETTRLSTIGKILADTKIVAATKDTLLLVSSDLVIAQALYKKETREKVLEAINKVVGSITNYYCIFDYSWAQIKEEYLTYYKLGNTNPTLNKRDLHLYQENIEIEVETDNRAVKKAKEYFNNIKIEIEE